MTAFTGIPVAALDFYDDLEADNSRAWWLANKTTYDESVRAPMIALAGALAGEFGEANVYRPHRDVRFSRDKTRTSPTRAPSSPRSRASGSTCRSTPVA